VTAVPEAAAAAEPTTAHLLVRAGDAVCALPLARVRRVVKALAVHRLPGAAPELLGLAEHAGEPLAVIDLARLVGAAAGANPTYPVTVVAAAGPEEAPELIGLAADAALEVVALARSAMVGGDGGVAGGEVDVAGEVVRVVDLEALGAAVPAR
jgi:chemotaxis signal transduction protein